MGCLLKFKEKSEWKDTVVILKVVKKMADHVLISQSGRFGRWAVTPTRIGMLARNMQRICLPMHRFMKYTVLRILHRAGWEVV